MLTAIEAAVIVTDCIRQAVGFTGVIRGENMLLEVGIVDSDAREALNDEIVTNPTRGVLSENHSLGPDQLGFTINTTVSALATEVMLEAVPLAFNPQALAAAAKAGAKGSKKGGKGGKRGAKKGGKKGSGK